MTAMQCAKQTLTDDGLLDVPQLLGNADLGLDPVVGPTGSELVSQLDLLGTCSILQLFDRYLVARLAIARGGPVRELDMVGSLEPRSFQQRVEVLRSIRSPEEFVEACIRLPFESATGAVRAEDWVD